MMEIRSKVKKIIFLDVRETPDLGKDGAPYDVSTSAFCLETATKSAEEYTHALKNVAMLLKPGGYIVLAGSVEEHHYDVGEYRFWNANTRKEDVQSALETTGFTILEWRELANDITQNDELNSKSKFKSMFVAATQKAM